MKVYFIGAGPGDPDLITLKGKELIQNAEIIIYAGSLVNPRLLQWKKPQSRVYDSAAMTVNQVTEIYQLHCKDQGHIARLHTGDPSLYSAMGEQIRFCREKKIPFEVVPGVSSFCASAAALCTELTLPGITQSIVITRRAERTPMPEKESLEQMARSGCTLVLFLSVSMVSTAMKEIQPFYKKDTPAAVVYRASWPDQRIITGTIDTIADKMESLGIKRQSIIIIGDALNKADFDFSRLYAPDFSHQYRNAQFPNQQKGKPR
ncbi:MAG: precorrin-4 C(11)-methyltransferase [Spirochaetales bacterium]|nr:precorrin-4 C(11)-methyltransferase [Spirochaetales bacterium]